VFIKSLCFQRRLHLESRGGRETGSGTDSRRNYSLQSKLSRKNSASLRRRGGQTCQRDWRKDGERMEKKSCSMVISEWAVVGGFRFDYAPLGEKEESAGGGQRSRRASSTRKSMPSTAKVASSRGGTGR